MTTGSRKNWEMVVELLTHMRNDKDLMLEWALIESGDIRSDLGRRIALEQKRAEMHGLIAAVTQRVRGAPEL